MRAILGLKPNFARNIKIQTYNMHTIGVFPGSFDPFTLGHQDLVAQASSLFDEVVIAFGVNNEKKRCIPSAEMQQILQEFYSSQSNIRVESYTGLTLDFCKSIGAKHLIRGLRGSMDFEYERSIAEVNRQLAPGVQTVFLLTPPAYSFISATIVRDLLKHGASLESCVDPAMAGKLADYYKHSTLK